MRLQKLLGHSSTHALLVSEIALFVTCYTVAAYIVTKMDPTIFLVYNLGLVRIAILVAVIVIGLYLQDLYEDLRVRQRILLVQQVCLAVGLAFLLQALLNYADSDFVFPRWMMLLGSGFVLFITPLWRILFSRVVTAALHSERVLFLGYTPLSRTVQEGFLESPERGWLGIGYVGERLAGDARCTYLGPLWEFREIVDRERPDRIIVSLGDDTEQWPEADLLELRFAGVEIEELGTAYERLFDRVCVRELRPAQLIFSAELGARSNMLALQSAYSWLCGLMGLLATLPIIVLAAALVRLTSRGPVLYRQRRVGRHGREFTVYKFRSMYVDAEAATGAVWAQRDDPRVTPVGRWLRRFRIDEIPQLFNVLKGEMVMVGPRPERPEFVETLVEQIPFYRQRLSVKPGVTGWAQINYGYGDTIEDTITKLEYDLYYLKNLTLAMDAYVLFHTAKVVLLGRGAQ